MSHHMSRIFQSSMIKILRHRFCLDQSGTTTVSFVLWLPIFMMVFALVADASLAFGKRSTILRVVQDTNRAISVGKITDMYVAETEIKQKLATVAPGANVTAIVENGVIISTVTVPLIELTSLGFLSRLVDGNVIVTSQHLAEG
ncbi:TadE/TadG family type IV pilus assembly protein [Pseudotabrizicola sediminis]|uniref:TadE/TadG family type IV pilus assembly protein n=1 Tax=Pseudotabrizicola sediminis TaxID=2486418 RepID=UPI00338D603F